MYQYMDEPCQIIENVNFCRKTHLKNLNTDTCIPQIINNRKADCQIVEDEVQEIIQLIESNYILIKSKIPVHMQTTCDNNIGRKTLKGVILIYFDNCTISINGFEYSNKEKTYWDSIQIAPTFFNEIYGSSVTQKLSLKKLSNWTIENTKAISIMTTETKHSEYQIYSTIFIYGLLIIGVYTLFQIWLKSKGANQLNQDTHNTEITTTGRRSLKWPSLHTKSEGVTLSTAQQDV